MPKSTTGVHNPKEPSSVSSMALDDTFNYFTDLTDCQGESSDMVAAAVAAAAADKNSTSFDANACENKQVFRKPSFQL